MRYLAILFTAFMMGCEGYNPAPPSTTNDMSWLAKKPFGTIVSAPSTFLAIPDTDFVGAYGDTISAFHITAVDPGFISVKFSVMNPDSQQNFHSGNYPDPSIYTETLPHTWINAVHMEIQDNTGTVVESQDVGLYDAGDTEPLTSDPRFPHHESGSFEGFWISAMWANLTTANNNTVGGSGLLTFTFSSPLPVGDYTCVVVYNPLGVGQPSGQTITVTQPFSLTGPATLLAAPLKNHQK